MKPRSKVPGAGGSPIPPSLQEQGLVTGCLRWGLHPVPPTLLVSGAFWGCCGVKEAGAGVKELLRAWALCGLPSAPRLSSTIMGYFQGERNGFPFRDPRPLLASRLSTDSKGKSQFPLPCGACYEQQRSGSIVRLDQTRSLSNPSSPPRRVTSLSCFKERCGKSERAKAARKQGFFKKKEKKNKAFFFFWSCFLLLLCMGELVPGESGGRDG